MLSVVSLAAVFSIVTQRSGGGALRDDSKNGCDGAYAKRRRQRER